VSVEHFQCVPRRGSQEVILLYDLQFKAQRSGLFLPYSEPTRQEPSREDNGRP